MKGRLNKFLAGSGQCSRRQADRLIEAGRVRVNGQRAEMGQIVTSDDLVELDDRPVTRPNEMTYLMVNKPIGTICTTDPRAKDNILDLVGSKRRLHPVGRLDVESSGLLILTDDGELTNWLIHPRYGHEKEYQVRLTEPIADRDLNRLSSGIELNGRRTLPADVFRQAPDRFAIAIREGRNRQIRRMCEALGHQVRALKRVRVHTLRLGRLRPGQWREITAQELSRLRPPQKPDQKISTRRSKNRPSS